MPDSRGDKNVQFYDLVVKTFDSQVHYIHDGSENYNDSFILDLEFTTSVGFVLPAYLLGRNSFVVHVDIAPVNDPPFLFIAPVKVLRLAEVSGVARISNIECVDMTFELSCCGAFYIVRSVFSFFILNY